MSSNIEDGVAQTPHSILLHPWINRLNEVYFRYLFASEERKPLAIDFLSSVFADKEAICLSGKIVDVKVHTEVPLSTCSQLLTNFLDLEVISEKDEHVFVALMTTPEPVSVKGDLKSFIGDNDLFYCSYLISRQDHRISDLEPLPEAKPVMVVNLLQFELHTDREQYHSRYEMRETTTHALLTDLFSIHHIEIPKCVKGSDPAKQDSRLRQWCYYLTGNKNFSLRGEIYDQLVEADFNFVNDSKLMALYRTQEDVATRLQGLLTQAWRNGRDEASEKLFATARRLLDSGMSKEQVQQFTELPSFLIERISRS